MQQFFLEKNRSEFSNDVERTIQLGLSTKTRPIPNDDIVKELSLFEQYNKEKDGCNKYRIILSVNPICSNVLFNKKTEITLNEGSENCKVVLDNGDSLPKNEYAPNALNTNDLNYLQMIRNTEYTHKELGGFVYHCGADIFNNHMLRKKEFVHVNKYNGNDMESGEVYNTIFDYSRDGKGKIIRDYIHINHDDSSSETALHLYQYDTIMSVPMAFSDNCIEKDGWWGFTNPNTIECVNSANEGISINRMMADNKACEFIDLYPDRSLFSFVPKYNKHRNRVENNWDYCITYPYAKDLDMVDQICNGEKQAIRVHLKYRFNANGVPVVECTSYFKHNLKVKDYISFYYYVPNKDGLLTFTKHNVRVRVEGLGDVNGLNTNRIFVVKYDDIRNIYEYMVNNGCFYKRNNGNTDCLYYFRKFKKLKTVNGEEIKSDINKIAFGVNIYGDDLAQIIFTDDIDVSNLTDHNGRPLTELFLTIIKRNAGRKEWYEDADYGNDAVEFSHCFGEVTSGLDFSGMENEPFHYNVHILHNIKGRGDNVIEATPSQEETYLVWGDTVTAPTAPNVLEEDITIEQDEFYGDIVEYDVYGATETVIGNVYHRFNTVQRECWNEEYKHIMADEIVHDDYDEAYGVTENEFQINTYYMNNTQTSIDTEGDDEGHIMHGNISPEGYFYNPHTRIKIREVAEAETISPAKYINYSKVEISHMYTYLVFNADGTISIGEDSVLPLGAVKQNSYYTVSFEVPVNYGFYKGDYVGFYDTITSDIIWGEIFKVDDLKLTLRLDAAELDMIGSISEDLFRPNSAKRRFYAYWSPNSTPNYAKLCEGAKKFVWRNILPPSNWVQDNDLYDMPFANGRFYIEKNVNFFLKRQDPDGKYGLSTPIFKSSISLNNPMLKFGIIGNNPIDVTEIGEFINNLSNICF